MSSSELVEVAVKSVAATWLLAVMSMIWFESPMIRLLLESLVLGRDEHQVDYMQCLMKMKVVLH